MTAITRSQGFGRLRNAWAAAHAPAPGVPHWASPPCHPADGPDLQLCASRVCTFHAPIARGAHDLSSAGSGVPGVPLGLYVVLLSIVSELLAFAAIGLISTWGEVFPRWIPALRGRRVPTLAAVIPAALGAAVLTLLWTWTAITQSFGLTIQGTPQPANHPLSFHDWKGLVAVVAYAPLLLWGPLLAGVTVAYWRRRNHRRTAPRRVNCARAPTQPHPFGAESPPVRTTPCSASHQQHPNISPPGRKHQDCHPPNPTAHRAGTTRRLSDRDAQSPRHERMSTADRPRDRDAAPPNHNSTGKGRQQQRPGRKGSNMTTHEPSPTQSSPASLACTLIGICASRDQRALSARCSSCPAA